ncbi:MAG TPA: NADH-quinone oxidoreductase subunit H [Candidatus Paceibacterota bacterium]|nr:NADH-quinone oxidoreductase subunit H [Verrucomicrobiota bacterium]HRY49893.1 NADH-quinone oxidoreductase subunit H [Candidatus Paceibacterota bacterium]
MEAALDPIVRWMPPVLALGLSPLMLGIIHRTKALFGGRRGAPLFQVYYDLWKLVHKGAVYSRTTSWLFRAGPIIGLAAVLLCLFVVPMGGVPAPVAFTGDLILLVGLLGLMRFVTVLAALDTGSSFEGMGASREVQFAALAEPALLLILAGLARLTHHLSLSEIFDGLTAAHWSQLGPALALMMIALMVVVLAENCRIPVDDPATHLELTMIHEVMVLDHGGPDFAFIQYGAALKLWVLGILSVNLLLPAFPVNPWLGLLAGLGGLFGVAVLVGVVESTMARLRMLVVPQLLIGAGALAAVALIFLLK